MTSIHIGFDSSLMEEGVSADNARVFVEANNGEVSITCAWGDAWAGYKVVHEGDDEDVAFVVAKAIAADPVAELARMGYDCAGWFIAN